MIGFGSFWNGLSRVSRCAPCVRYRKLNTDTSAVSLKNWKTFETLLYYESPDVKPSEKIACFGYNKCLVTTSLFQHDTDAWRLRYSNVPQKLKELHLKGYKIVVFSNQSSIGQATDPEAKERAISTQTTRMRSLVELLELPIQIFVATAKPSRRIVIPIYDLYRKPNPGMWNFLISNCNGGIAPNMEECFYVGGVAGRPASPPDRRRDHGNYDSIFAQNTGLKFYTDDEYFGFNLKQLGPSPPSLHKKEKTEKVSEVEKEKEGKSMEKEKEEKSVEKEKEEKSVEKEKEEKSVEKEKILEEEKNLEEKITKEQQKVEKKLEEKKTKEQQKVEKKFEKTELKLKKLKEMEKSKKISEENKI